LSACLKAIPESQNRKNRQLIGIRSSVSSLDVHCLCSRLLNIPFASCLLDQTNTILSTCPYTPGCLTAYQPSSLSWALLSLCLELNPVFQLKHCQHGMENSGLLWHLAHTHTDGWTWQALTSSIFLLVSCSFVAGRYHSTRKWREDNSGGNEFCRSSKIKSLIHLGFFIIFQMYSLVSYLRFFFPRQHFNELEKNLWAIFGQQRRTNIMLVVILLANMNAFPWNVKKRLTVQNFLEYSQVTSERVKFRCALCLYGYCCCYVERSRPTVGNRCWNTSECYHIARDE